MMLFSARSFNSPICILLHFQNLKKDWYHWGRTPLGQTVPLHTRRMHFQWSLHLWAERGTGFIKVRKKKTKTDWGIKSWRNVRLLKVLQSCHFLPNLVIFPMQPFKKSSGGCEHLQMVPYRTALDRMKFLFVFPNFSCPAWWPWTLAHWKSCTNNHLRTLASLQLMDNIESSQNVCKNHGENLLTPWYPSASWEQVMGTFKTSPKELPSKMCHLVTFVSFSS